jgi:protein TonB
VATDGHVYEVTPIKSVPGADEDIIQGIREGWLYKPQQVPVCFLYNIPITIQ